MMCTGAAPLPSPASSTIDLPAAPSSLAEANCPRDPRQAALVQPLVRATCRESASGDVACGWNCLEGKTGEVKCAQSPDGTCIALPAGGVRCTDVGSARVIRLRKDDRATCTLGTAGDVVCGWDCRVGADGMPRCSQSPDGACISTVSGSVRCFDGSAVLLVFDRSVRAGCVVSASGNGNCGYDCVESDAGDVACANTPDGACRKNAAGDVTCTQLDPRMRRMLMGDFQPCKDAPKPASP